MEIQEHASLEDALQLLRPEHYYTLVKHVLSKGEKVGEHFHPYATEVIIASGGGFHVLSDLSRHPIENPGVVTITLPKESLHGLEADQDISYLVLRDEQDKTVWLSELMEQRPAVAPISDPCGVRWNLYNNGNISIAYLKVTNSRISHWHERTEETYRAEVGRGRIFINDQSYRIEPGATHRTVPPDAPHFLEKTDDQFEVLILNRPGYDQLDVYYT